jgi:hypothetical protein
MANEIKAMDLKDCTVSFRDGTTPTPFELEIKVDEGNLTWTESRNLKAVKDRRELQSQSSMPFQFNQEFQWRLRLYP